MKRRIYKVEYTKWSGSVDYSSIDRGMESSVNNPKKVASAHNPKKHILAYSNSTNLAYHE
jgi:hypothetical protein